MATIQISADLTPDKILEAVKQFSPEELEEFTLKVHTIRAQRTTPHLSQREAELLKQINEGLPPDELRPLQEFRLKMEAGTITETEHAKYLQLTQRLEQYDVKRLAWLIELAQLRNQTVAELIDNLGLQPSDARQ
jgi:hypothetical protein